MYSEKKNTFPLQSDLVAVNAQPGAIAKESDKYQRQKK